MHNPLHQFLIRSIFELSIGGIDISFTNSALCMMLATTLIVATLHFGLVKKTLVPNRLQSVVEISYEFIAQMIRENAGREGLVYFPFVFSLFMFVLLGNLLGMVPYSFTFTSHIIVTFALALVVFLLVTIVGLVKHKLKFFRLFCPEGVPILVALILVPIEIITYFIRPVTLALRLFANMLAGHVILKVFAAFAMMLGIWGIGPLALNVVFIGFEFFVAGIQAFIFTILTCLYLHDALHLH